MKTIIRAKFWLICLGLLGLNLSCSNDDDGVVEEVMEPQAAFTFEVVEETPQLVSFTNTSKAAEEFEWDFGDESELSTQRHPSHRYLEGGDYTVTLTAFNGDLSEEFTQEITILGVPKADFDYSTDEENPLQVHFQNQSGNSSEYTWEFGDGSEGSTEEHPSHTFEEAGTYLVTLNAKGAGGTAEVTMEVMVTDEPAFSHLYLVGDALSSGWSLDDAPQLAQDSNDKFIFTYDAVLSPGKFKIATGIEDFCASDWFHPLEADRVISTSEIESHPGCEGPDNQWLVTEETQGRYRITVDLWEKTVSFEELTPAYTELYLLGDAAPNGWNLGNPEGFTQSDADPFEFTYETILTPGGIKISTYTGDFCDGAWLHPTQPGQSLEAQNYHIIVDCEGEDWQWQVTEETQGKYLITVNLYEEKIIFNAL